MKRVLVALVFLLTLLAWAPRSEAQVWRNNGNPYHQTWRDQHRRHEVREQQRRRIWREERREHRWRHHRRDEWRREQWRRHHRRW